MADDRSKLTKNEARQGDEHKTNLRVLIFGVAILAIGFAIAVWFYSATYNTTPTTTESGQSVEDSAPDATGAELDAAPTPVPEDDENVVPTDDPPAVEDAPAPQSEPESQ